MSSIASALRETRTGNQLRYHAILLANALVKSSLSDFELFKLAFIEPPTYLKILSDPFYNAPLLALYFRKVDLQRYNNLKAFW